MIKYSLLIIFMLSAVIGNADTRAIVPRGNGEGSIGDASRAWGTGVFSRAIIRGTDGYLLPEGATGVNQVATWNGTNWVAQALGAPSPTPTVGTNVAQFTTTWPLTNTFIAPSTQILFTAWGAGGGSYGGGAGHARAIWQGQAGTIFDIVVATSGSATTNGNPGGGRGIGAASTNAFGGGGFTYVRISGDTNFVLIAAGSGGGSGTATYGGPGGGFYITKQDGVMSLTNVSFGQGAWASNEYGLAATAGTNRAPPGGEENISQNGSFLQGGKASTNGCTAGITTGLGGGGGGYYGGAGAVRTNATQGTASTGGAGGGGGLSYANTNYLSFAQLIAGQSIGGGVPAAQDHPTYTAGRGLGGGNSAGGAGCAGAMW